MAGGASLKLSLGAAQQVVDRQVADWLAADVPARLLARDPTLWFDGPVDELADRLGWLDLPSTPEEVVGDWVGFAEAERESGIERVVVLGMGGSSLAPEVFERTFGDGRFLTVLDTTHPRTIRRLADELDRDRTLFVVSSKSGSTIETRTLLEYFWDWAGRDGRDAGRHFVAVTDPGSALGALAAARRMHRVFRTPPEVGGRYSALTAFGLVPAALSGVDVRRLLSRAAEVAETLRGGERATPLLSLGAAMGHLALAGRDKLTLVTSDAIDSFPDWLEQLIAESTGKHGQGIVPVPVDGLGPAEAYGDDRFFVGLLLEDDRGGGLDRRLTGLASAGHPVAVAWLEDTYDLGAEIYRWEVAVALSGAVLGINPFDQPDVQLAKKMAQAALAGGGDLEATLARLKVGSPDREGTEALRKALPTGAPSYIGIQAFLPPSDAAQRELARIGATIAAATGCATTTGFGPRFLHSTGQLHKGGPAAAHFIQLVGPVADDVAIPGESMTFGELIAAQADGDAAALLERGRDVVRLQIRSGADLAAFAQRLEAGE